MLVPITTTRTDFLSLKNTCSDLRSLIFQKYQLIKYNIHLLVTLLNKRQNQTLSMKLKLNTGSTTSAVMQMVIKIPIQILGS